MSKSSTGVSLGDIITLDYSVQLENGATVLSTKIDGPLTFQVGHFELVPGLNNIVIGMAIGDRKEAVFSPLEAFGDIRNELILETPIEQLSKTLIVGQKIVTKNSSRQFIVKNINLESGIATLDGNHILAGKQLTFNIKLLTIKFSPSTPIKKKGPSRFGKNSGRYKLASL